MEQPILLVGVIISVLFIFNLLLLYYLKQVYGRDKKIAEFIQSNDTLILSEAQQKAKSIIEAATLRAKQTLTEADYLKSELSKKMEELLTQVANNDVHLLQNKSNEINLWYKNLLERVEHEHAKKAEESIKSVEGIIDQQIHEFSDILKKQTMNSETMVTQRVNEEYAKSHQEIEQYKQQQMQQIAQAADALVLKITEEVLGKALTTQDHKKLIFDALEKAKHDGLFTAST